MEAAEAYGAKNREERPLEPNAEERKRAYANNVNPWSRSSAAAAVEAASTTKHKHASMQQRSRN